MCSARAQFPILIPIEPASLGITFATASGSFASDLAVGGMCQVEQCSHEKAVTSSIDDEFTRHADYNDNLNAKSYGSDKNLIKSCRKPSART